MWVEGNSSLISEVTPQLRSVKLEIVLIFYREMLSVEV